MSGQAIFIVLHFVCFIGMTVIILRASERNFTRIAEISMGHVFIWIIIDLTVIHLNRAAIVDGVVLAAMIVLYSILRWRNRGQKVGKQIGAKARALRDKLVKSARKLADGVRIPLPAMPQPG